MTLATVLFKVEGAIKQAGSMRAFARKCGVSAGFMHDVRHSRREPADKILRQIGLAKIVTVTRKVYFYPVAKGAKK